ncbi:hypothetical protein [Mastigocoleus sp. MO_188.B34]|uniref:hypothetical protein n=1 Tax=Mastigocoleus sp. MO_188.B34 TaxID=3036635 RepID=UPI002609DCF7|nr:hypothetical protein [Mastigocoleus sp. MO_188.B34]MDJ0696315.1 hypothetical protein [Mastigocoleus sp. MO_188.B34]
MAAQPPVQYTATETYSKNILGPVFFEMSGLQVGGSDQPPPPPLEVALSNSPYIIATNEEFQARVKIKFNDTSLTRLLLCLGAKIEVNFCAEGCGHKATEKDLIAYVKTKKDVFEYEVVYQGTPDSAGLTEGFYVIAAVANIGPCDHPCAQFLFGAGYVARVYLQVYEPF